MPSMRCGQCEKLFEYREEIVVLRDTGSGVEALRETELEAGTVEGAESQARSEARRSFNRETLLAVQEAAAKLARATGKTYHDDTMEYAKSGLWGREIASDEANDLGFEATPDIQLHRVRLEDAELRGQIQEYVDPCLLVSRSGSSSGTCFRARGSILGRGTAGDPSSHPLLSASAVIDFGDPGFGGVWARARKDRTRSGVDSSVRGGNPIVHPHDCAHHRSYPVRPVLRSAHRLALSADS